LYQDHQAHIAVHQAAMQDPKILQLIGQNPNAQAMQSAMQAHINEHIAYEYRKQMEEQMGMTLPFHPDEDDADKRAIPPEMEVKISQLAAQASQVLLQRDKTEIAAKQAQQAAQDPIIQMQMQELKIKQMEVDIKNRKLAADAAAKADQLEIEKQRIESQEKIAGMQATLKSQKDQQDRLAKQEEVGARLGVDMAKTKQQLDHQKEQAFHNRQAQSQKPQKGNK